MNFYMYNKITKRDIFFEKWWANFVKCDTKGVANETLKEHYSECLEIIVNEILNENTVSLYNLIRGDKVCGVFFDYITGSRIKNAGKVKLKNYLDTFFVKRKLYEIR